MDGIAPLSRHATLKTDRIDYRQSQRGTRRDTPHCRLVVGFVRGWGLHGRVGWSPRRWVL